MTEKHSLYFELLFCIFEKTNKGNEIIMTIESIYLSGEISVRSYNSCKSSEIDTVKELIEYYEAFHSFLRLRMCGEKSNLELIKICEIYSNSYESIENKVCEDVIDKIEDKVLDLNSLQKQIVNHYISIEISKLSIRSRNAITFYLENKIDINNFSEKIFSKLKFNFKNIDNIGKGSVEELELFFNDIKEFFFGIYEIIDENELNNLKLKLFLKKEFIGLEMPIDLISKNSIFSLIQFFINEKLVFNTNETYILENSINIYENSVLQNLDELSEVILLTKEGCRKKRMKILEELESKFVFLTKFDENLFIKYKIDFNENVIIITDDIAFNINSLDETNFSKPFITLVLSFFFHIEYELLGNQEDVFISKNSKSRNRHNWKGLYLVSKKLNIIFDFQKFIEDIEKRNNEFIVLTYKFNFKSYLSKFLKKEDSNLLEILFNACEKLLNEEFNIFLDIEENIIFERKSIKTLPIYAFEALEILGKPSHLDEINKQIKISNPEFENIIRGTTLKSEFGFVPFGRTSVYGLKKWEFEKENIRGGTIKKIAYDYLLSKSSPIHLIELMDEVSKYRLTNQKSLLHNLKLDPDQAFIFFNQNFIGLKKLNDNYDEIKYKNLPIQLGKKIIGLVTRGKLLNEESVIEFLVKEYKLNSLESINLINYLKTTSSGLFNTIKY